MLKRFENFKKIKIKILIKLKSNIIYIILVFKQYILAINLKVLLIYLFQILMILFR